MQDVRAIIATLHRFSYGARYFQEPLIGAWASIVYPGVGDIKSDSAWPKDGSTAGK